MPFGFHLTMDTLPSGESQAGGSRSALARIRLSLSCPFRLLHTFPFSGPRGITPAFGYGAPHPSARGTSTLLSNALLSAHYGPVRLPAGAAPRVMHSPEALAVTPPLHRASQVPRQICPRAPSTSTPGSPTTASAHASSSVSGFIHKGRTGHSQLYPFTRPNRFAFATAHEFASPGFAKGIAPFQRWFGYMYDGQFTWSAPHS